MTIEEFSKRQQEETDNMTLLQARDIIASRLCHFDMRIQFEKAVKMLLDCVDEALEQGSVLDKIRAEIADWQTDIHDNEYDAETHDFVFERIYEIIDEHKAESEG